MKQLTTRTTRKKNEEVKQDLGARYVLYLLTFRPNSTIPAAWRGRRLLMRDASGKPVPTALWPLQASFYVLVEYEEVLLQADGRHTFLDRQGLLSQTLQDEFLKTREESLGHFVAHFADKLESKIVIDAVVQAEKAHLAKCIRDLDGVDRQDGVWETRYGVTSKNIRDVMVVLQKPSLEHL